MSEPYKQTNEAQGCCCKYFEVMSFKIDKGLEQGLRKMPLYDEAFHHAAHGTNSTGTDPLKTHFIGHLELICVAMDANNLKSFTRSGQILKDI